jgi:hypothetical protein
MKHTFTLLTALLLALTNDAPITTAPDPYF